MANLKTHTFKVHSSVVMPEHLRTHNQRMLRLLLNILVLWVFMTFFLEIGYRLVFVTPLFSMFGNLTLLFEFFSSMILPTAAFAVSFFMVLLGYRGVRNPNKIGPFFAIIFIDAMLIGWDLASRIFAGVVDITYIIYGCLIIMTAIYAWQVKKATYPEDWFEQKEAARELRRKAKKAQKAQFKQEAQARRAERRTKFSNSL